VSYRVFARKYRPQTFEEVVGQEHITKTLQNAIASNRLAQAYLFVGPRGIGKTSTARILAKALNCKKGPTTHPCGECDACREIAEGNNLDVLEIDGASNNTVDNVRDLRDNVAYAPTSGQFKIYLIDEVHMLSGAAFNALLKTLEEPPPHVKFIFATTEAHKLPATITSRCQRFDLRRIPAELIAAHLLAIASKEKIDLAHEAADAIARGADGGLRDAESMLDQMVAFCGEKITEHDVQTIFGFTSREVVTALADAILQRDTAAALALLQDQSDAGKELSTLLGDLIGHFRDLLVGAVGKNAADSPATKDQLLELLDHFGETAGRLKWSSDKKLLLDVAAIKAVQLMDRVGLDEVLDTLATLRSGGTPAPRSIPAPKATTPPPTISTPAIPRPAAAAKSPAIAATTPAIKTEAKTASPAPAPKPAVETPAVPEAEIEDVWRETAGILARESVFKFDWLKSAVYDRTEGGMLHVRLPESLRELTGSGLWRESRRLLEERLSKAASRTLTVEPSFYAEESEPAPEETDEPHPETGEAPEAKTASEPPKPGGDPMAAYLDDPVIRAALDIFEGQNITVKS